ncbi:MAG TPA: hypothetical protein VMS17_08890 [Gemmataceae bacterium]|nr:hypothetical protein [Gemmataceae bacterium]
MRRTLDEIYREGLQALRDRLGRAGMVRFLQQFESGKGDYAEERHAWVDRMTLENLRAGAGIDSPQRPRGGRRKR